MEIDINIRNATPEEAQRVLIGMSFAEDILGKLSPAVRIEKAERPPIICDGCHPKPCSGCRFERQRCKHRPFVKGEHSCSYFEESVPDPTCDEETGCAGCKDFGKNGACETCSPHPGYDGDCPNCARNDSCHMGPMPGCFEPKKPVTTASATYPKGTQITPTAKKTRAKGPVRPGPKIKNGIPAGLATSDPRLYARLLYRINKGGMTYEEALSREDAVRPPLDADKLPTKQKKSSKTDTPPAKTLAAISPNTIVTGMHVRQIKPDQGRQIFGTAVVLARVGDMIEVRNGGGKKHKIDARCLEVVPAGEASDRATGVSS